MGGSEGIDLPGTAATTATLRTLGVDRTELRRGLWEHPFFGVARLAGADAADPVVRILDAVPLAPADGAIGGWSSARLQGVRYLDGFDRFGRALPVRVHETARHRVQRRPGIDPTRCQLRRRDVLEHEGIRVTSLPRALYDEMRLAADLTESTIVVDMGVSTLTGGVHTSLVSVRQLVAHQAKTRGIVQARSALELATDRSCSPLESRTRAFTELRLDMHGWRINEPVFDLTGRLLGIPDLLDPLTGLVIESDGGGHREQNRHSDDNIREELFETANLTVVRVTSRDFRWPDALASRIAAGDRRARGRAPQRDCWTLTKPPWWATSRLAARWG